MKDAPRRGFLYWAYLDKRRPVLVISQDIRNRYASGVLIVPCYSHLRFAPTHVELKSGEGGAAHASMLHAEEITTLFKPDLVSGPLGPPLTPSRLSEVEHAVMLAIGVVV